MQNPALKQDQNRGHENGSKSIFADVSKSELFLKLINFEGFQIGIHNWNSYLNFSTNPGFKNKPTFVKIEQKILK